MPFHSILFDGPSPDAKLDAARAPDCFGDLGLDQIVDSIAAGRDEYDLRPYFWLALHDVDAVLYRQQVFTELGRAEVFSCIDAFARRLHSMRDELAQGEKLYYTLQKQAWFLDAVELYCDAVSQLARDLTRIELRSRGVRGFRDHVVAYMQAEPFRSLCTQIDERRRDLAGVQYCLHIRGTRVRVTRYEGEDDYSQDVEQTFERFHQGRVKEHLAKFSKFPDMNHVEAGILGLVAKVYPDVFAGLQQFCEEHRTYVDPTIGRFDREIQFYLAYLLHLQPLQTAGLTFSFPAVSDRSKEVRAGRTFDLALAGKRVRDRQEVVTNDFYLHGAERIFVVTGPNQGGKTTFARTFGQLHYLASLGCPVPGEDVRLFLWDRLLTHFEREEDAQNLNGKLQSDLLRMRDVLQKATPQGIVIMNEVFTSTTLQDALLLSQEMLRRIIELDVLCVCVTFLDELSTQSASTVSMVAAVVPDNPAQRTYKIERRPADGLAYAVAIAEKYGVTNAKLRARLLS